MTSTAVTAKKVSAAQTIVIAGLLCGVLDITAAFITWGIKGVKPYRILQAVASSWLGARSFNGGMATAALGLGFHFLIALSAATVFYATSRKLPFMISHPVVSGTLYGVAVYVFMYWVVMPLSNVRRGPFSLSGTIIAVVTHIVCVGLPISLVVHHYSRQESPRSA
jgi:hypothetical protein